MNTKANELSFTSMSRGVLCCFEYINTVCDYACGVSFDETDSVNWYE